jgi:hypothetical protein
MMAVMADGSYGDDRIDEGIDRPTIGNARIVYIGHLAPYWEIEIEGDDSTALEAFRERAMARLTMLPPYDPQFRRNNERVTKDAVQSGIALEWDTGIERDAATAQ